MLVRYASRLIHGVPRRRAYPHVIGSDAARGFSFPGATRTGDAPRAKSGADPATQAGKQASEITTLRPSLSPIVLGTVRVVHEESADINIRRPATRRYVRFVPYEHAFGLADQIPAIAIGAAVEFPALNGHAHPGAVLPSRSQRMWP